jgi:hypothetical protein
LIFRRSDETTDRLLIADLLHSFGPTAEVIVPLGSRSSYPGDLLRFRTRCPILSNQH